MPDENVAAQEALHGERMIEVKLRFWTNDIAGEAGKIRRKHAWSGGVVRIESNPSHGIVPGKPKPFHSLLDVGAVIEELLIEQGIVLHPSKRMRKYVRDLK
ncbi:MAG: hypothetical protein AABY95_08270 [Pseudomonadota bacterium]